MMISFDLDDTLICYQDGIRHERNRVPWFLRWWLNEPVRKGTRRLLKQLRRNGWDIAVYTTSRRSERYIRMLLWLYGARPKQVINQQRHDATFAHRPDRRQLPSKVPYHFNIHLHVDDCPGVAMEGRQHQFRVVQVDPHDHEWADKVLRQTQQLKQAA